jgi:hypothetical protein
MFAGNPTMGLNFTLNVGLNRWADANQLVVFYPQNGGYAAPGAPRTSSFQQQTGCWDSYGQTGDHYADRNALQFRSVMNIVDALPSLNISVFPKVKIN